MPRFTPVSSPPLESELERHFARLRLSAESAELGGDHGACLVLGGGYGRGEGSVLEAPGCPPRFFNDLDYFLFVPSALRKRAEAWRQEIESEESEALGIDVEIKVLGRGDVGNPSESMMMHDLVAGHHVVFGDGGFLAELNASLDSSHLPMREATRLLWNRGTGLYFARCRIAAESESEFISRNHAKAKLALGDALLCAHGRYAASFMERAKRLEEIEGEGSLIEAVRRCHREGVAFRLRPTVPDLTWAQWMDENRSLSKLWVRVFLDIEGRRLGRPFYSAREYARYRGRICREVPLWKAPIFAVRDLIRHHRCLRPIWDYPRSALLRALSCLIDPDSTKVVGGVGKFIPRPVGGEGKSMPTAADWEGAYCGWWRRYS